MFIWKWIEKYPAVADAIKHGIEWIQALQAKRITQIAKDAFMGLSSLGKLTIHEFNKWFQHSVRHIPLKTSSKTDAPSKLEEETVKTYRISLLFFILQPIIRYYSPLGELPSKLLASACGLIACSTTAEVEMSQPPAETTMGLFSQRATILGYTGSSISFALQILKNIARPELEAVFSWSVTLLGGMSITLLGIGYTLYTYEHRAEIWESIKNGSTSFYQSTIKTCSASWNYFFPKPPPAPPEPIEMQVFSRRSLITSN